MFIDKFCAVIFYAVFRRLGTMYTFKSFFLNLFYKIYKNFSTFIYCMIVTALENFTSHYPSPQFKQVYFKTTRAHSNCLTLNLHFRISMYIYKEPSTLVQFNLLKTETEIERTRERRKERTKERKKAIQCETDRGRSGRTGGRSSFPECCWVIRCRNEKGTIKRKPALP